MKKITALFLALCMVLSLSFAFAETTAEETTVSTYMLAAAVDSEGNAVTVGDENMPILVLGIDGASNQCAFGTESETVEGTYEIVEGDNGVLVLTATLNDGSSATMFYSVEDDAWCIYEETSGVTMFLVNVDLLEDAAQ